MLNNNNYMCGDQCGEFVCGYWGLKDLLIKQIKIIRGQLSRKNMMLSHMKITCYLSMCERSPFP